MILCTDLIGEAYMAPTMTRGLAAFLALLLAASIAACGPPPSHTNNTRGTTGPDRDTGMHDGSM